MTEKKGFLYRTFEAIQENILGVLVGALVLSGLGGWIYSMYDSHNKSKLEQERIKAGLEIKVGDYNGNALLDRFYEIDGKKIPVEIDGKPIEEYFRENKSK